MQYTFTSLTGNGETCIVKRVSDDRISLKLGDKEMTVLTEDFAAMIRQELPKERAQNLFKEIEEKAISQGKARVCVRAKKLIQKGEEIYFTIDINKYLDPRGNTFGVRSTNFGFIY